jgi:hypothetical protein
MPFHAPKTQRRLRLVERKNIICLQGSYTESDHLCRGVRIDYNEYGIVKIYLGAYNTCPDTSCCVTETRKMLDIPLSIFEKIVARQAYFEEQLTVIASKNEKTLPPNLIETDIYVQICKWDIPKINIRRWVSKGSKTDATVEGVLLTPSHFAQICGSLAFITDRFNEFNYKQVNEITREKRLFEKVSEVNDPDTEDICIKKLKTPDYMEGIPNPMWCMDYPQEYFKPEPTPINSVDRCEGRLM